MTEKSEAEQMKILRTSEYAVLIYRILLCYVFYFFARVMFAMFNWHILSIEGIAELMRLSYFGLAFDTTSIIFLNGFFIIFSALPLYVNTGPSYQKFLAILYFSTNLPAMATNFVDFIYYRFTYTRSSLSAVESIESEPNKFILLYNFLINYWYVYLLFFVTAGTWIYLYKIVKVKQVQYKKSVGYVASSMAILFLILVLGVGGARGGDFKKSSRPINLIDANRNVTIPAHGDVVLNTPFVIFRTINMQSFKKIKLVDEEVIEKKVKPVKRYDFNKPIKPNIVLIILESIGREYCGAFNKEAGIENYQSFTPFIDSLAKKSLIFTNAFTNGSKSIHAMASIIAGVPSFKNTFTSSQYPNQPMDSLVSILKKLGYDTSFFHGAPNGSMGFQGFANILGFDHYYGRNEFNDNSKCDGVWGIWDEPFFLYMKSELDKKQQPFFATLFSLSSHEPYIIPKEYEGIFPEGYVQIHKCVGYTDHALRKFFEEASKQEWYKNTIFVITADHTNQSWYEQYRTGVNRYAVPILFYRPDSDMIGVNKDWAQQIDIFPTLMDMIGWQQPFRSWGRSLLNEKEVPPFCINYSSNNYQFKKGDYVCTFNGEKIAGLYHKNDYRLNDNLISSNPDKAADLENSCKAFLQDYYARIVDRRLTAE